MSKWLVGIMAVLVTVGFLGCNISDDQAKIIAQSTGMYSSIAWIVADNPTVDQKTAVVSVLDVINTNAINIKDGKTYTEVIYPEVEKYIDTKVKEKDRAIAKKGALAILNGLDSLFATHPEWRTKQDLAIDLVGMFVSGVKIGLGMKEDNPVIVEAKRAAEARARILQK